MIFFLNSIQIHVYRIDKPLLKKVLSLLFKINQKKKHKRKKNKNRSKKIKKPSASFFFVAARAVESIGAFVTSHNRCEARRH